MAGELGTRVGLFVTVCVVGAVLTRVVLVLKDDENGAVVCVCVRLEGVAA